MCSALQAALSGAGGRHRWLSALGLVALAKQSSRPLQRLAGVAFAELALLQGAKSSGKSCDPCRT